MDYQNNFKKYASNCPYRKGSMEAGAVCHYYGEAAFSCDYEKCPLYPCKGCRDREVYGNAACEICGVARTLED